MYIVSMKPYSIDLREKILRAYDSRQGSQRTLARLFGVSEYFIRTLLKRRRETGSIAPKPHSGGRKPNLDESAQNHLIHLVAKNPDATLDELCTRIHQDIGQKTSPSAMCRLLKRLHLVRKKSLPTRLNAIVQK